MVAACFEGGEVEVDDSNAIMTKSLRKRTTTPCSEVGVKAVVCSGARDEAVAYSRAEIKDGRWWQQRGGF
jgi:hypothetical protein